MIDFALYEFTRRVCTGGGISLKGIFLLPVYYIQMIFALPFSFFQFLLFQRRINNTAILKDPVFILGHYRSGTTYLQKLLASDKRFGFLTNYDAQFPNSTLLFGKRMQPVIQRMITIFSIKNPFFHNHPVLLSEPAEEDDYLMNKASAYSAYWGLVFPKRWREWLNGTSQFGTQKYDHGWKKAYLLTLRYATFRNNGKQLVLKSPPNTGRISLLLQLFPQAKFIFISRNPIQMYYSIRNMWTGAILKYYSVQEISDQDLDEIIFGHYEFLLEAYERDKNLIPKGNLMEISYEELIEDSFGVMQKVYSELDLPRFESAADDLLMQLEREKGYQPFPYQISGEPLKRIKKRWGKYIVKNDIS